MKIFALLALCQVCQLALTLEMPPYDVVNSAETYEERVYPARKWVSTYKLDISYDNAVSVMFHKLFDYIDGQNEAGIKVDMTAPVTVLIKPGEGPNCANNFTESFYVPAVHQDQPFAPTNTDVYIEDRPELHVFSRRFHGWASDEDWITNAAQLHDDLVAAGVDGINYDTYYTASYQSPYAIIGRNNEVWFMKQDMN